MAIIGRIAETGPSPDGQQIRVRVDYFDDNDPANAGVGSLPPQIALLKGILLYPPTLTPGAVQAAAKVAIQAKIDEIEAERSAVVAVAAMLANVRNLLPVGALIDANS